VTIATDVRPDQLQALQRALERVDRKVRRNGGIFRAINANRPHVHFARWVLLMPQEGVDGHLFTAQLIYAADVDLGEEPHLALLVRHRHDRLDDTDVDVLHEIYRHTADYAGPLSDTAMIDHLNRKQIKAQTSYVNKIGRTVEQVWREERLRARIEGFLDSQPWAGMNATDVRVAIRDFVQSNDDLRWALQADEQPHPVVSAFQKRLRRLIELGVHGLERLGRSPLVPAFPNIEAADELERDGQADIGRVPPATIEGIDERDNHGAAQSPFSVVGEVRPGFGQVALTRIALGATDFGARYLFGDSDLAGVKSIHFARWVFVEENRAMFCSTYDGSMENYMSDFVDKVSWGLNFTFGRGVGFPPTVAGVLRGAEHELKFRQVLRKGQIPAPTLVWYSAYPQVTALNLKANHEIREGLVGEMNEAAARAWLRNL